MLGARLAVPGPQRIPTLLPVPNCSARGDATVVPLFQQQRKGQPSPSPARAQHSIITVTGTGTDTGSWRNRPVVLYWCCCGCERLKSQKGLLSVTSVTAPVSSLPHPRRHLSFSTPHSPTTKPSLRTCFTFSPLSRLILPVRKAAHRAQHRGPRHAPSFFLLAASLQKLGLYSQARRRTAPQYPRGYNHQVPLYSRCGERSGSSAPFSPWSVDSCGQPPNLKSPSSCALSSRVQPILPVLPSRCQVLRVEAGPSCW